MIKKLFGFILVLLFNLNIQSNLCFAAKRDVQDPVLREIINEFGNKIPKFTNKYGDSVFVQDGSVTRGDLITALYEYDKKTKASSNAPAGMNQQIISKNEFDALKNRIIALEKNGYMSSSPAASKNKGSTDIIKIISDLEPNMPMLLDNSLKYSKVFNELQQRVESGAGRVSNGTKGTQPSKKELMEIKRTLSQIQSDYVSLSKRIDELNSYASSWRSEKSKNTDLSRISKQLNEMKRTISETPPDKYHDNSESSSSNKDTSKLVGVSVGLSMIAALFVSR